MNRNITVVLFKASTEYSGYFISIRLNITAIIEQVIIIFIIAHTIPNRKPRNLLIGFNGEFENIRSSINPTIERMMTAMKNMAIYAIALETKPDMNTDMFRARSPIVSGVAPCPEYTFNK